jgi:ribonuclease VapC
MSTATYLELAIVLESRLGSPAAGAGHRFVRDALVDLVDLDSAAAERAIEGWRRFGKGRHRASLNLGDCFTYGLSMQLDEPILCVGEDFVETDAAVLRPPNDSG